MVMEVKKILDYIIPIRAKNVSFLSEFHAPLHKQLITLQKFSIPISIDISIKTHKFVCIRQA